MDLFAGYLKTKGMKATPERMAMARIILTFNQQFTIDQLFHKVKSYDWPISKSTLYRTMPHLIDAGLLKAQYSTGEKKTVFSNVRPSHTNAAITCSNCGVNYRIDKDILAEIFEKLCRTYKFHEITASTLAFDGCCLECESNANEALCPETGQSE